MVMDFKKRLVTCLDHINALEIIANKGKRMNTYMIGGGNQLTNLHVAKNMSSP